MAWLRIGDTFATDPRILALNDPSEPLLGPACRGFFLEVATLSAAQSSDYVINRGWINLAGGVAADQLLKRCLRAGLITDLGGKGAARRWKLIDDAPELIHIRLKDEIAWEKQQKADTRNRDYQVAVFLRDGDACRWCGVPVQPYDNKSRRGKTVDHLRPGLAARGPEDLVVACRGCNGQRGKDWQPDEETADAFAARWAPQLRPVPTQLFFVRRTVEFLETEGHTVPAGSVIADRAHPARDTASTPSTTQKSGQDATHPATQARVAAPDRSTTEPNDQHPAPAGVAATDPGTTDATRPAPAGAAASPAADQHPAPAGVAATADSTTAPECTQHPASQAGVAGSESRNHRTPTDRSGSAPPGRVGTGRVGPGGSLPPQPSPTHPPDLASPSTATQPRRTRRGRRRTRSTGDSPDQHRQQPTARPEETPTP